MAITTEQQEALDRISQDTNVFNLRVAREMARRELQLIDYSERFMSDPNDTEALEFLLHNMFQPIAFYFDFAPEFLSAVLRDPNGKQALLHAIEYFQSGSNFIYRDAVLEEIRRSLTANPPTDKEASQAMFDTTNARILQLSN